MTTETIVGAIISGCQLLSIFCYMVMFFKTNKNKAKNEAVNIMAMVPNYVTMAKATIPNATSLQITNYVLAMIKSECEEAKVKFKETKVKAEIEKELEK